MNALINDIKHWLSQNGRPLEVAKLNYFFFKGSKEEVIDALLAFQNADGGFAHGLEPDFFTPTSNPIDTWTAINIMWLIDLDANHPLIQSTLNYLKTTPYKENEIYYFRIPDNNNYPHAPWWYYTPDNKIEGYNPTASLYAFILKYENPTAEFYQNTLKAYQVMLHHFLNHPTDEMHELRNFIELYDEFSIHEDNEVFKNTLIKQICKIVEKDAKLWFTTYCVRPSQLVSSPDSVGYQAIKSLVHEELDELLKQRNEEGVWDITWRWDQYEADFLVAKKAWMGVIAFDNLYRLKRFE